MAILFVTHFLDQTYAISDRITVMRNGEREGEYLAADLSRVELVGRFDTAGIGHILLLGFERESDIVTPSFHGMYDKVLAVGSMSKAYGLPGLRTGWVVGPAGVLDEMWARVLPAPAASTATAAPGVEMVGVRRQSKMPSRSP